MPIKNATLVTLATYNEIENLPRLVEEIFAAAPQVDIVVIDDNSPDGTGAWCDQTSSIEPRLHCLHRSGKLGLGTAIIAGMKYAIEHGYEFVLNMDADFSHHPRHLPALLAGMEQRRWPARRRDDWVPLCGRRGGGGLALETAFHEPRGQLVRTVTIGTKGQGLQRIVSLLPHRRAQAGGFFGSAVAGVLLSRRDSLAS